MVNTGPKTEKGKKRKLWGDGRRRTPDEEFRKFVKDTEGAMKGASSGKKKNQAKKKK